jgi:hypothetical protein
LERDIAPNSNYDGGAGDDSSLDRLVEGPFYFTPSHG